MITAIDTNVLLDILVPNVAFYRASEKSLQESAMAGALVICDIVYAELSIHFNQQDECDEFLEYRRNGGKRTRVLADFLVGAHAQKQATGLLSRDRGFYRSLFPSLGVRNPA